MKIVPVMHKTTWVVAWLVWAGAILFLVKYALASQTDLDAGAQVISWVLAAILVVGAAYVIVRRRWKRSSAKGDRTSEQ